MSKLKRSEKLAFIAVGDDNGVTYHRLKNFTEFSVSKNPVNYSRQYIDEDFERNDVVSYAPSISYSFDYDNENPVHALIVDITDNELVGDKAIVDMVFVDISNNPEAECTASLRQWSLIPDKEGNDSDAYDYSGTFRANGQRTPGVATSSDNWESCIFVAE
ncbi:MAG: hypothetical protein E7415_05955 [Ruminococcaceae bacterium]|nr:hypothetical protein [Oscillospiraceae bacterium]